MKVLVDECVPFKLVRQLLGHTFQTAQQMGWSGYKNGDLLAKAEREFELFLTGDRNLEYQQNLKGRKIGIVLLSTNHWPTLKQHVPLLQTAIDSARAGEFTTVEIPER